MRPCMRTRPIDQIQGAGYAGAVLIKLYRAGALVIPGMISHRSNACANQHHRSSLGSVDYFNRAMRHILDREEVIVNGTDFLLENSIHLNERDVAQPCNEALLSPPGSRYSHNLELRIQIPSKKPHWKKKKRTQDNL